MMSYSSKSIVCARLLALLLAQSALPVMAQDGANPAAIPPPAPPPPPAGMDLPPPPPPPPPIPGTEAAPVDNGADSGSAPEDMAPAGAKSAGSKSSSKSTVTKIGKDTARVVIEDKKGADAVPPGQELVNMDFPEKTEIRDIVRAVALWTGKNVILDNNVSGKIQIISPRRVTKEEAYQAFLSALNVLRLTTVETGKILKIVPISTAVRGNLRTFLGSKWTPLTDEIITQIIPLKYVDARSIQNTLGRIVTANSVVAYEKTNTLIISDSGYKVRRILDASRQTLSLETPVGSDGDANLADFIEDYHGATPAESATHMLLRERLSEALTRLPERERRIIQLRYGLEDGRSRTLEEVGREFGITRERTRQIEGEALRKLRHPGVARGLRSFLE
jgi:RNA polymerase sigma factor (sigma-70 family)